MVYTLNCIYSQDLDDESVLETVDFSEFEALFQLNRSKNTMKLAKREESQFKPFKPLTNYSLSFQTEGLRKASEQLCLIESRRARNLG